MPLLILLHGLPGSGKSFKAKQLREMFLQNGESCVILSTDEYWGPEYNFDLTKLRQAHQWNQERCKKAMASEEKCIIIDNTNLEFKEVMPYLNLAKVWNYDVELQEADTDWKDDVGVCTEKTTHNVPPETMIRMKARKSQYGELEKAIKDYLKQKAEATLVNFNGNWFAGAEKEVNNAGNTEATSGTGDSGS